MVKEEKRGTTARFFGLAEMKIDTQNPNGEGESEEFGFALGDSLWSPYR